MIDHAPLIERAFMLGAPEQDATASVSGLLPPHLRGTCYWNGPGLFSRGDVRYRNWLDGDGLVCALAFAGGAARVTTRFVQCTKFAAEEAAGRPLFRTFGTAFEGDRLRRGVGLESPANVSVYPIGASLLAFGEQGLPWELDPVTLETRGAFTFDGQLNDVTPFSAHPKFDPLSGEVFNFGVSFSPDRPTLNLFRFASDGALAYRRRIALPYPASIHDFALSASHAVFFVSPYVLDMEVLLRGRPLIDALRWQPERGSHILVVDRATGELAASIPAGSGYCLHLVNAFEAGGQLVVDIIEYDRPIYDQYQVLPSLFTDVPYARPVRLTIAIGESRIVARSELAYTCAPDFPAHDVALTAAAYSDFWMLGIGATGQPGRKFFNQLVHLNWDTARVETYHAPPGHYLGGEPLYVGGSVICQQFDAERSQSVFAVFDAQHVSRGPLATVAPVHAVPLLFHSSYLE